MRLRTDLFSVDVVGDVQLASGGVEREAVLQFAIVVADEAVRASLRGRRRVQREEQVTARRVLGNGDFRQFDRHAEGQRNGENEQ